MKWIWMWVICKIWSWRSWSSLLLLWIWAWILGCSGRWGWEMWWKSKWNLANKKISSNSQATTLTSTPSSLSKSFYNSTIASEDNFHSRKSLHNKSRPKTIKMVTSLLSWSALRKENNGNKFTQLYNFICSLPKRSWSCSKERDKVIKERRGMIRVLRVISTIRITKILPVSCWPWWGKGWKRWGWLSRQLC